MFIFGIILFVLYHKCYNNNLTDINEITDNNDTINDTINDNNYIIFIIILSIIGFINR